MAGLLLWSPANSLATADANLAALLRDCPSKRTMTMMATMRWCLVALAAWATACSRAPTESHADAGTVDDERVVARIDGVVITVADVQAQMAAQPPGVRASYQDPQRKKQLLDGMIRTE